MHSGLRVRAGTRGAFLLPLSTRRTVGILLSWLILSFAVWLTAVVLPGFHVKSLWDAVVVALIVGLLNFFLGWLFFAVFTIATLGLAWLLAFITRWIINAIILKFADAMTDRLKIDSFGWALGGAFVISVFGAIGDWIMRAL
ncbi:MAG: phage holin family protein [Gemmatimonas sp.]|nr:phage holin family protein [Gemmatimonas sp.]